MGSSKGFTEISRQDPLVRLSNAELQISSTGIWWGSEHDSHGLGEALIPDTRDLLTHLHLGLIVVKWGDYWGLRRWRIPPPPPSKGEMHSDHGLSLWEVSGGDISDRLSMNNDTGSYEVSTAQREKGQTGYLHFLGSNHCSVTSTAETLYISNFTLFSFWTAPDVLLWGWMCLGGAICNM